MTGKTHSNSFSALILVITAAVLFGASAPLSKLLLGRISPISLAGFLYLGSGLGSWLLVFTQHKRAPELKPGDALTRADIPWLAGAIAAGGIAAPILLMLGLTHTPASTASLLLNFESVATAFIAIFFFRESTGKRVLWAMGMITAAAILLSWTSGDWGVSLGALGVLGACLLWGLDNNFTRHISARNPLVIVGYKGLISGSFSLGLSILLGNPIPAFTTILAAMVLGAFSYGISIYFFILALRHLGAARTSTLFGTSPFVGVLLSFILLRESPPVLFWIALPLMLAGAWLMMNEKHSHRHEHNPEVHSHPHTHPDIHHDHEHGNGIPLENGTHTHVHTHAYLKHEHEHTPDLHHWHQH